MASASVKEALARGQCLCQCQFIGEGKCLLSRTLSYRALSELASSVGLCASVTHQPKVRELLMTSSSLKSRGSLARNSLQLGSTDALHLWTSRSSQLKVDL